MSSTEDRCNARSINGNPSRRSMSLAGTTLAAASAIASGARVQVAQAQQQPASPPGRKPNILVIFGDDIGQTNLSCYSFGVMGYETPNIDRIAKEGSGLDWFPTLLAAAGDTTIKDRLLNGTDIGGKTFKVHLEGYNQLPYLTGQERHSARSEFAYFNDDGVPVAYRLDDWKAVFVEMKYRGGFQVWQEPFTVLRVPKLFHLRMDPYERADIVSDQYFDWLARNDFKLFEINMRAAAFLETFVEYPPSQEQASFSIDQIAREVEAQIKAKAAKAQGK
jgi:arylsulfatase A-like enzyme